MGFWSALFGDDDPEDRPLYVDEALDDDARAEQRRALLKKIRKLEIVTRRIVNEQLAGSYHSAFKGRGMDFDEVRSYNPGDEIRFIDWNVSARLGELYVKRFTEERELTVFLLVDTSSSLLFGSQERTKLEAAAEIAALLAFSAIQNNDRIGLILFNEHIERFVPPKKGRKHVLRLIKEILDLQPAHSGTSLENALQYLARVAKRRAVAFVISDFQDDAYKQPLLVLNRRHDVIPIVLEDPAEGAIPDLGLVTLEDPETGEQLTVDTSSRAGRQAYADLTRLIRERRAAMFRRARMDFVPVDTSGPSFEPLVNYFRLRARR